MAKKKRHYSIMAANKGQAIFELILFVPFILGLYFYVFSLGSAINGSINQQKAARGYFYGRLKNNSMMPKARAGGGELFQAVQQYASFDFMGWMTEFVNQKSPKAACYELMGPFVTSPETTCASYNDKKTKFIRVQTVYGVCGVTLIKDSNPGGAGMIPVYHTSAIDVAHICINR